MKNVINIIAEFLGKLFIVAVAVGTFFAIIHMML